jgi:membrane-associated phospholipid phosphatase
LAEVLRQDKRFWAVDKIVLAYFGAAVLFLAIFWTQIPEAGELVVFHLAGAGFILMATRTPGRATWYFHHWYPLPFVAACYREMAVMIPAVWNSSADGRLADLDFAIWHANPTVWLERIQTPALTEFLQIIYTLFLPVVLLIPFILWGERRYKDFRYCAFLLSVGFLACYAGYMVVPARGPRFFLQDLQHVPLQGMWMFKAMQGSLDRLESAHYDCFPSGHVELTMLAWWSSRQISKTLFWIYSAYTLCIIFATVYLRYHYTVDLVAGAAVATALLLITPALYRKLSGKEDLVGSD